MFSVCHFIFIQTAILAVNYASSCEYPLNDWSSLNFIDVQNVALAEFIPLLLEYETPVAIRSTSSLDASSWNCLATYSTNVLDAFTLSRPIISNNIPSKLHTTENRVLCSIYSYATVWDYLSNGERLNITFTAFGIETIAFEYLLTSVNGCNDDITCLSLLASSNNYCPDIIGVIVGSRVNNWLRTDGWNQDGSKTPKGKCTANCRPYSDSLGLYDSRIKKTKSLYKHKHQWENLLEDNGLGFFYKQEHVTPHIGFIGKPRTMTRQQLNQKTAPRPRYNYKDEAELVINRLADLAEDDEKKAAVEIFDNKFVVLFFIVARLDSKYNWSWEERQFYILGATSAEYDSVLLSWKEKVKYNRVRPTTIIQSGKYTNDYITTWGGPNQGLKNIRSWDFQPYIRVMPHAEYPSASGCICKSLAEFTEALLKDQYNDDSIDVTYPFPNPLQPGSRVEDALGPVFLSYSNLKEVYEACGASRLWGGMHFTAAISGADMACTGLGQNTYDYVKSLLNGVDIKVPNNL